MVLLIVISAALAVWGAVVGFTSNDGQPIDVMLYWAYVLIGIALVSWVIVGGILMAKDNPKSLLTVAPRSGRAGHCMPCCLLHRIRQVIPGRNDTSINTQTHRYSSQPHLSPRRSYHRGDSSGRGTFVHLKQEIAYVQQKNTGNQLDFDSRHRIPASVLLPDEFINGFTVRIVTSSASYAC